MDDRRLHIIERPELNRLIGLLQEEQRRVIGPAVRDGTIVHQEIHHAGDLPVGWSDEHEAGHYRAIRRDHEELFGHVLGADSWKRYLLPPTLRIFAASREGGPDQPFQVDGRRADPPRFAFLGVRACELAAIAVLDRVVGSELLDPYYRRTRDQAFVVSVNCTRPGGTCFCASLGTGPRCTRDFDLCLTELDGELAVEVGTEAGATVFRKLQSRPATATERRLLALLLDRAAEHMGRRLETAGLPELLAAGAESPHWEEIARRCLACGNCTMVCPTCFCCNVHDGTDLACRKAERWRLWGSCFTLEFSYLGSTTVRTEGYSRYRHWMTHKLSSWHEQFGTSGCVGCGRCITWCPAGIDITAEAAVFRREAAAKATGTTAPAGKETGV